jgi:hypothetical protein
MRIEIEGYQFSTRSAPRTLARNPAHFSGYQPDLPDTPPIPAI